MEFPKLFLLIFCLSVNANEQNQSKEVATCKRNDPTLSECYCSHAASMIPMLQDGIPEMNLPSIDPFITEHVGISFMQLKAKLSAELRDIYVVGLSRAAIEQCQAHMTFDGLQAHLVLHIPEIHVKSNCQATFNVVVFNFNVTGDFYVDFSGVQITGTLNTTRYVKSQQEYLKVSSISESIRMAKLSLYFDVFGTNLKLNAYLNGVLNGNIERFYATVEPTFLKIINEIAQSRINEFLEQIPFDVLFAN